MSAQLLPIDLAHKDPELRDSLRSRLSEEQQTPKAVLTLAVSHGQVDGWAASGRH